LLCAFIFAGATAAIPSLRAQDVTIGQTPQEANDRIRALSTGAKSAPHDYIIGEGDVLDVSVFDVPELTRQLRVSQTGTISIPLIPVRLRVTGLTELQAEQKISEVLESNGLVTHPDVAVVVKEHKSKPITIVGAVMRPMVYEADRQVNLLEALAEAGGVVNDAGDMVIVTRQHTAAFVELPESPSGASPSPSAPPGSGEPPALDSPPVATPLAQNAAPTTTPDAIFSVSPQPKTPPPANMTPVSSDAANTLGANGSGTIITVNLRELLETGDTRNNIPLQAGDVVTVPHAGIIYVLGAVARPGGFVLANDRGQLTTLKVLSLAGGTTTIAKLDHAVIIRKDDQGKQSETEVDLKKVLHREAEDLQLRPSDILYIPDNRTKEFLLKAAALAIGIGTSIAIYQLAYH
jgi:polysaccharide export outer membrane protein